MKYLITLLVLLFSFVQADLFSFKKNVQVIVFEKNVELLSTRSVISRSPCVSSYENSESHHVLRCITCDWVDGDGVENGRCSIKEN